MHTLIIRLGVLAGDITVRIGAFGPEIQTQVLIRQLLLSDKFLFLPPDTQFTDPFHTGVILRNLDTFDIEADQLHTVFVKDGIQNI